MKMVENIVGKGENAGNQHFLLFPQCFVLFQKQISVCESHVYYQMASIGQVQISSFGHGP